MQHATALAVPVGIPTGIGRLTSMSPLERIFFGFLADYEGHTRDAYEYHLQKFFAWCELVDVDPLEVDRTHASLYIRHLSEERGLRGSSVNTAMTPVKGLYKWAMLEGYIDRDPVVHVKLPKSEYRQKYPLDRDELRRFRSAAKNLGGRHWALGEMLTVCALRITEARTVLIENCREVERGHRVMFFRRKGGRWETIPLPYVVGVAINDAAGDRTSGPVITKKDGTPLGRGGAAGLVRTIVRRAGIERPVNPHLVRGSTITLLLDSGGDIREAQRLAGHLDPRTTSRHYDLSQRNHDTHPAHVMSARLTVG